MHFIVTYVVCNTYAVYNVVCSALARACGHLAEKYLIADKPMYTRNFLGHMALIMFKQKQPYISDGYLPLPLYSISYLFIAYFFCGVQG